MNEPDNNRVDTAVGKPMDTAVGQDADGCLPAPSPEMVRAARAYLTPCYATGVEAFLWEAMQHPLPDQAALHAITNAADRAQHGDGEPPQPLEVAAALVILGAARLDLDQTEARLLQAAQAVPMNWEQIAAILHLTTSHAEERHRRLKPRLDQPVAHLLPPHLGDQPPPAPKRNRRSQRPTRTT